MTSRIAERDSRTQREHLGDWIVLDDELADHVVDREEADTEDHRDGTACEIVVATARAIVRAADKSHVKTSAIVRAA